ncbi:MAG: hypothetical protein FWD45_02475 [Coriobacteriia bacterium]|nr:hypothetical protein [Coriobacteriia bacterium]
MEDSIIIVLPDSKRVAGWAVIDEKEILVYKTQQNFLSLFITLLVIFLAVAFGTMYGLIPGGILGAVIIGGLAGAFGSSFTRILNKNAFKKGRFTELLFKIQFGAITGAEIERFQMNQNALGLTMKDGTHLVCLFGRPRPSVEFVLTQLSDSAK